MKWEYVMDCAKRVHLPEPFFSAMSKLEQELRTGSGYHGEQQEVGTVQVDATAPRNSQGMQHTVPHDDERAALPAVLPQPPQLPQLHNSLPVQAPPSLHQQGAATRTKCSGKAMPSVRNMTVPQVRMELASKWKSW